MPILGLHRSIIGSQLVPEQWNFNAGINAIALERNANGTATGKIYVGGEFTRYNGSPAARLIRLNSNGTVDNTFNTGVGFSNGVTTIVPVSGSTQIYVGGYFSTYSGSSAVRIARINSNGTLDTTFNTGTGFAGTGVAAIALASGSTQIYVGGIFSAYSGSNVNSIARINSNGTLDTTFNVGTGATITSVTPSVLNILPVTQSDGQIYIVGNFNLYSGSQVNGIARINSNGTLVGTSSFNPGVGNATGFNLVPRVICQAVNSTSVYVGGNFTTYSGSAVSNLVRINSNGTLDTTFNTGTGFSPATNITTCIANTLDGSGDIFVGGFTFTTYSGSSGHSRIIRLRSNGTINTSVSFGAGFNGQVLAIEPTSSAQVYMGGAFTTYKGSTYNYVIKLTS
jgi:uncharacterized delta-60 repeat protein